MSERSEWGLRAGSGEARMAPMRLEWDQQPKLKQRDSKS